MKSLLKNLKAFRLNPLAITFMVLAIITLILHLTLHSVRVLGFSTSIFYLDEAITTAAFLTTTISVVTGIFFLYYAFNITEKLLKLLNFFAGSFFIFLALDEYFDLHENLSAFVKASFPTLKSLEDNLLSFSWIISLLIFIVIAVGLLTFLIIKEKNNVTKTSYILGLCTFVLILALEVFGANTYGKDVYIWFVGIEETLEIIGITFFLNGITQKLSIKPKSES
jgi:hypothetical protein